MPPPPVLTQSNGSNASLPRPINGSRSPVAIPPTQDLSRPLPPPPSSSVDNYDIPALRRKAVPDQSNSGSQKHNRSFSHPFPSFFGSKRTEKKGTGLKVGKIQESGEIWDDEINNDKTGTPAASHTTQGRGDRQPVTGKCMTCDSTVRWPQGLKVYRCTTCLTINDLEPYGEQRGDSQPGLGASPVPAQRKPVVISIERTRGIIEHCLTRYFEKQLEDKSPLPNLEHSKTDAEGFIVGSPPEATIYAQINDFDSPPPSPRPKLKPRAPSDPYLSPMKPRRRDGEMMMSTTSEDPFNLSDAPPPPTTPRSNVQGAQPRLAGNLNVTDCNDAIFRTLENYIAGCFTGCAALNSAFFTVKPLNENRPGSGSDIQQNRQIPEPAITAISEPDIFISDLDAKTLLLGDFAENGSWWTGGRATSQERDDRHRDRSPERWKGVVNIKTPRINWIELAEWYRLVINAGDNWRRKWEGLGATLDSAKSQQWRSFSLDRLQRDITDSQIHLQRSLLKSTENLLKRPRRPLKHPEDSRFLLMLLTNPLLYAPASAISTSGTPAPSTRLQPDMSFTSPSKRPSNASRRPGSLGHHSGIIKRIIGLVANLPNDIHQVLVSWFSRFSDNHFQRMVEMIGSFVTYRLSRQQRRPVAEPINPTDGLVPSFTDGGVRHPSQLHAALEVRSSSTSAKASDGRPKLASYGEDWQVRCASRVMALLFQANTGHISRKRELPIAFDQRLQSAGLNAKYQAYTHGQIVPVSAFYNSMLDYADLVADFEAWETTKTKFTFCQYPFFLSIYAKIHILEHDAKRQMEVKAREAFFDSILSRKAVSQFLVLKVRRDCLVEDSLRSVSEVVGSGAGDIKKGLRIDFVGEEGIDAGGLRKEWFLLLVREIFDPHHGLFVYDEDSHYCYFNPFCFESSEQFFLVGVLLGLAIYNSTILDIAFPPFVFKKMLASAPSTGEKLTSTPKISHAYSLEDLAELKPALAKGLRQLLDFDGDVQETFCRDFVAETERYGELVQVPLCPGGEKRAVNSSNRREFVDLYIHYLLDTAVARQYEPFKRGFFTVCGGNALSLFRPEEIELLVRGSDEPLDITSLRAVATYEGWPKADGTPEQQPQVIWFWDFFQRASPKDQRRILGFITGSDRIPAMGATSLVIKIALLKDKDAELERKPNGIERFPTARTCFNTLSLYQYSSREKLEAKLWMAVTGSEGFGLR